MLLYGHDFRMSCAPLSQVFGVLGFSRGVSSQMLLKDGIIVQEGAPADLWHRPADPFVTRFVQAQRGPQIPAEAA